MDTTTVITELLENYVLYFILTFVLFWAILTSNRSLPPGPWGLPIFGYYPFLSRKVYLDFARLAKAYGSVFSFRTIGGTLFVVINDLETLKDVLVCRAEEFAGRPLEDNLLGWLSDGYGVTQEEGLPWKEHRRYFLQTVKNFGFGKIEIEDTIHEHIEILKRELKKAESKPINLGLHVAHVNNSVITKILFNRNLQKDGDTFPKLVKGIHELLDVFADQRYFLVGRFWKYAGINFFPWSPILRRGKKILQETTKLIVDDHVKEFDCQNLRDYVDCYLNEMKKLKENGKSEASTFTMPRLLSISMNMMMEGTESVSETVLSLLQKTSRQPQEQAKVQEELDIVVGRERLPSWSDKTRLPYVQAFIQELLRTASPFNMSVFYSNLRETSINKYRIPKRSIIVANLWGISNDPTNYPNPSTFDPGRFLSEDGEIIKTNGPYPFSIGKRDCLGQSLAKMEIYLILTSVLQSYSLQPGEENGTLKAIPRP